MAHVSSIIAPVAIVLVFSAQLAAQISIRPRCDPLATLFAPCDAFGRHLAGTFPKETR